MRSPLAVRRPHTTQQVTNTRKNRGRAAKNARRRQIEWQHSAILIDPVAEHRIKVLSALSLNDNVFEKQQLSDKERARRADKKREKKNAAKATDDESKKREGENKQRMKEEMRLKLEAEKNKQEEEAHKKWMAEMKKKQEQEEKTKAEANIEKKEIKKNQAEKTKTKATSGKKDKQPKKMSESETLDHTEATKEEKKEPSKVEETVQKQTVQNVEAPPSTTETKSKKKGKKDKKKSESETFEKVPVAVAVVTEKEAEQVPTESESASAPEQTESVPESVENVENSIGEQSVETEEKKESEAQSRSEQKDESVQKAVIDTPPGKPPMKTVVQDDLSFLDFVGSNEAPAEPPVKPPMKTVVEDDLSFLDFVGSNETPTEPPVKPPMKTVVEDDLSFLDFVSSNAAPVESEVENNKSSAPNGQDSQNEARQDTITSTNASNDTKSDEQPETETVDVPTESEPASAPEQTESVPESVENVENSIGEQSVETEEKKELEVPTESEPASAPEQTESVPESVENVENSIGEQSVETEEKLELESSASKNKKKNKKNKRKSESEEHTKPAQVTEEKLPPSDHNEISIADIVAPHENGEDTSALGTTNAQKKKNKKNKNKHSGTAAAPGADGSLEKENKVVAEEPIQKVLTTQTQAAPPTAQDGDAPKQNGKKQKNKKKNKSISEESTSIPEIYTDAADDEVAAAMNAGSKSPPIQVHEVTSTETTNGQKETTETITVKSTISEKDTSPTRFAQNVQELVAKTLKQTHHDMVEIDPSVKMQIDAQLVRLAEKKPVVMMETRNVITPLPIQLHVSRPSTPSSRERLYKLLPKDIIFCANLINSHGENYSAMAADASNVYKESARGLQRKIRIFKESPHFQTYLRAKEDGVGIETLLENEN